jgi:hypothetical protein
MRQMNRIKSHQSLKETKMTDLMNVLHDRDLIE